MITAVTIGWQNAGRIPRSKRFQVSATRSGTAAFNSAFETLKIEMLQQLALDQAGNLEQGYEVPFIAKCAEILRLRPWAISYEQGTDEQTESSKIGTTCECGASYDAERGGYACAFR